LLLESYGRHVAEADRRAGLSELGAPERGRKDEIGAEQSVRILLFILLFCR
jgi:hypothetical protein